MITASAPAKVNLALVVGPVRRSGKHEVLTVMQAVGLCDTVAIEPAAATEVGGFDDDTLVAAALAGLGREARVSHGWRARIHKEIPVAAGLGGGSADAATALRLANAQLPEPLPHERLVAIAAAIGADVPFFLAGGTQLGSGDGSSLEPLALPLGYAVLLALPHGATKASTASVYAAFDARDGARGFDGRRAALVEALGRVRVPADLASLPPNDLASSALAGRLRALGAFRADVSGAGPCVYGLFPDAERARAAGDAVAADADVRVTAPVGAWAEAP